MLPDDLAKLAALGSQFRMPEIKAPLMPPNPVYEARRLDKVDSQRDRHDRAYARAVHLAALARHLETRRLEHNSDGTTLVKTTWFLLALLGVGVVVPLAFLPVVGSVAWTDLDGSFWTSILDGKVGPIVLILPTGLAAFASVWVLRRAEASKLEFQDAPEGYQPTLVPGDFADAFLAKEMQQSLLSERAEAA